MATGFVIKPDRDATLRARTCMECSDKSSMSSVILARDEPLVLDLMARIDDPDGQVVVKKGDLAGRMSRIV